MPFIFLIILLGKEMNAVWAGKKIIVGVCGSIAAFKVAGWVSNLIKAEADVEVVLTEGGGKFIKPLTFAALTGRPVYEDLFDEKNIMAHIDLGRDSDLYLIAPASANTIAKLAVGMADDVLTTSVLAARSQVVVCPAMNPDMYAHPATQINLNKLKEYGYKIIEPDTGHVACKEEGKGRLPEWKDVEAELFKFIVPQDYSGETLLVTAGPTREPLDPARFISNRSSGRMGYAIAEAAQRRGASVTLVTGPVSLAAPKGIKLLQTITAEEMFNAVVKNSDDASIIIKSAAVSDFRPEQYNEQKVKKERVESIIQLVKTQDILKHLGVEKKENQLLIGFAAESENIIENGRRKLESKNLDMVAVNDISCENTGFESVTNQLHLLTQKEDVQLPHTSKAQTANLLLDNILKLRK